MELESPVYPMVQDFSVQVERELEMFFNERPAPAATDPLKRWSGNASRFPYLAKVAKALLCVPATSVPSERVFSAAGHIVSKRRAGLSEENIDALIVPQQNRSLKVHASNVVDSSHSTVENTPVALDVVLDNELL